MPPVVGNALRQAARVTQSFRLPGVEGLEAFKAEEEQIELRVLAMRQGVEALSLGEVTVIYSEDPDAADMIVGEIFDWRN